MGPTALESNMSQNGQRFLVIDNKSFDMNCEDRRTEGLRICEKAQDFRTIIFLEKAEVDWLLTVLEDFY